MLMVIAGSDIYDIPQYYFDVGTNDDELMMMKA